jgi:hypothetical protein
MRTTILFMTAWFATGCVEPRSPGGGCTISPEADGSKRLACADGTSAVIRDGRDGTNGIDGADGASGTSGASGGAGRDGIDGTTGMKGSDGANGQKGADGTNSLVRIDLEPPGEHCELGGQAIRTGIDLDADHALSDGEISGTTYVCSTGAETFGPTLNGSFVVYNAFDLARLANVTHVRGNLELKVDGLDSASLPALQGVDGYLEVTGNSWDDATSSIHSVSFPALTHVGSLLIVSGTSLSDLSGFPQLGGAMYGFGLYSNFAMTSLAGMGAVTGVDYFDAWGNRALTSISFPEVETMKRFTVIEHEALAELIMPSLSMVGTLSIYGNPVLPQCAVDALYAQLSAPPEYYYGDGNDPTGTCGP